MSAAERFTDFIASPGATFGAQSQRMSEEPGHEWYRAQLNLDFQNYDQWVIAMNRLNALYAQICKENE